MTPALIEESAEQYGEIELIIQVESNANDVSIAVASQYITRERPEFDIIDAHSDASPASDGSITNVHLYVEG